MKKVIHLSFRQAMCGFALAFAFLPYAGALNFGKTATGNSTNKVEADLSPLTVQAVEIIPSRKGEKQTGESGEKTDGSREKVNGGEEQKQIRAGDTVELKLKLQLDPGFHAYADQYKLTLVGPKNYYLSEFQVRPTIKFTDPLTKKIKIGTEGYSEMVSLLDIPQNATSGRHKIQLELIYQACGTDFCLFPKKIPIEKDIFISDGSSDILRGALSKGWFYSLVIVFIAGVLTSLTPCIFPMIPITMAILGTTSYERSRFKSFLVSLSYVFGIALTYSLLGVMAAKTGALFGSLLGHPLVVGLVASLFVLMGLSMYGLFEIQMPSVIANKISKGKMQKNALGAFLSGLIAGVVASPCVGPVLISILAYVAQTQNVWVGFVLLFTFALGLGQLFLIIGTFNSFMRSLPRSGPWMEQVKFIFGSIMIAMALYYIYPVTRGALFDGLVAITLISLSLFFGVFQKRWTHIENDRGLNKDRQKILKNSFTEKIQKFFIFMVFMSGIVFAAKSLAPLHMQEKLFSPALFSYAIKKTAGPQWVTYSDELLEKAKQEKRPVIIDFQAEWCLACKELELYTFSDPQVLELGRQFIWLTFDATSPSDQLAKLQKRYGIGGLPFVVIYNTHGKQLKDETLTGFEPAPEFLKRMKKAL